MRVPPPPHKILRTFLATTFSQTLISWADFTIQEPEAQGRPLRNRHSGLRAGTHPFRHSGPRAGIRGREFNIEQRVESCR